MRTSGVSSLDLKNSMFDAQHELCFLEFVSDMNASSKSKSVKKTKKKEEWKPTRKVFTKIGYIWRPTGRTFPLVGNACNLARITATNKVPLRVVQIVLWYLDSRCSKHMTGDRSQLTNFVHKFLGTVEFGNDQIAKIMSYGDYQIGNITILRVYYVEGLGHNLFSVGQFCNSDLEVAFRKHTCFVRNLIGVDLLSASQESNLYTLLIRDIMTFSLICLLFKASKTKSWLWHRRLLYLNFGAIYYLARHNLVRVLPKLKFEKDHVCSECASKDEAPDFIIKFLKMIQVRLNATVRNIRTYNGTEFVNQTLRDYYEQVGISHETSVARTPQQNGVVERRNHTLVEVARTMLSFAQAPLFIWVEAIATAFQVVDAPRSVDLADSPMSMSIDQDTPSTSIPSSQEQEHSLIISQGFEESQKMPHFHDDPLNESLHENSASQESSSNERPIHTPFESLGIWTKDHHISNVIEDLSRPVSTRKQLQTNDMWCYFVSFLTFVEPNNFKQAMTE
nr:hypothetical protein [Tanacetum cinerariifolium]